MNSKARDTKRFINNRGFSLDVTSTFWVTADAAIGDTTLRLHDPIGLKPDTVLNGPNGAYRIRVDEVGSNGTVSLSRSLVQAIPKYTILTNSLQTKGLFTAPGRDITRDYIEFNRRIRVPLETVITYGSVVQLELSRYFVSGYQEGDSSLSIGLKLINEKLDWYSLDPDFESEDSTDDRNWPEYPDMIPRMTGIDCYQEQISLFSDLEEVGYVPSLNRFYVLPVWVQINVGDFVKTSESTMRVIGLDPIRIRNMKAIIVNYHRGVDVNAES